MDLLAIRHLTWNVLVWRLLLNSLFCFFLQRWIFKVAQLNLHSDILLGSSSSSTSKSEKQIESSSSDHNTNLLSFCPLDHDETCQVINTIIRYHTWIDKLNIHLSWINKKKQWIMNMFLILWSWFEFIWYIHIIIIFSNG